MNWYEKDLVHEMKSRGIFYELSYSPDILIDKLNSNFRDITGKSDAGAERFAFDIDRFFVIEENSIFDFFSCEEIHFFLEHSDFFSIKTGPLNSDFNKIISLLYEYPHPFVISDQALSSCIYVRPNDSIYLSSNSQTQLEKFTLLFDR